MRPIVGLFMTSVSGIAAWILNSVCKSIIGTDPKISRSEVQLLMESGYDEMIAFIKSILIAALIKYMEGGRPAYGWIISQLYKRGYMIKPVTADPVIAEDATARIRIIVHDRKWNQLCNPLILKDVLYLYGGAPSDLSETIAKYITYYDASLARFFALYSIIALFNQPLVLFPLSMLLIRRPTVPGAIARVVGGVLSYAYPDTLLICAVSELGECLYGSGTIWLFRRIVENLRIHTWRIHQYNELNFELVMYPLILALGSTNIYTRLLILAIVKYRSLFGWFLLGYLSDWHPAHMLLLSTSAYIGLNIYNASTGRPVSLVVIEDYSEPVKVVIRDDYVCKTPDAVGKMLTDTKKHLDDFVIV